MRPRLLRPRLLRPRLLRPCLLRPGLCRARLSRPGLVLAVVLGVAAAGIRHAAADGHGVTVQNGTNETIRSIQIAPTPGGGENRLRSQLPPGAAGRIGYSTGCLATVRLGFASGRTEDHPDVDVCSEPRVVAGTAGVAGPAGLALPAGAPVHTATAKPGMASAVKLAPAPVVPPWTGHSITKRFGGME